MRLMLNIGFCLTYVFFGICRSGGGGMFGDVNISAILDSFSVSYDKRVRPNYGGEFSRILIYLSMSLIH